MYAIEFLQTIKDSESIESQVNLIKKNVPIKYR